ncbi:MAG: flap endonuclease [Frankiales bacterium]|nr:flap endonuclease [Frankiales bacterium]MCW3013624.1 flap endonuclease [Solirubrobacterales bacterium]
MAEWSAMPATSTPAPLLVVDTPSLLYRAFFALPSSIKGKDGRPVNALLGCANLVLQAVETYGPRAVVLCNGAEAATYRTTAFAGYHAAREPMPEKLVWQWEAAPPFFGAFGWEHAATDDLEADDLLGSFAAAETAAGGTSLLFTGDRDMFQCVSDSVRVLYPGAKGGPTVIDAAEVRRRYGIQPAQVPDFIALRGDPSDGLPGAKGIGEKTAATLLTQYSSLEALLDVAAGDRDLSGPLTARARGALREQAEELRAFRHIATLQPVAVQRPADRPTDWAQAASAARAHGMERLAVRLAAAAAR